jgi:hypothetical protein
MKLKIYLLFLIFLIANISYGQLRYEWGNKFDFDPISELDPNFVLKDNYNHFLLTVANTDGMLARHQVILRKFDQKNQLLTSFIQDFPKIDDNTLYNYLGFAESNSNKVAVFIQAYSGKAKKSSIYKLEFDKATNQFINTEIFSIPILSAWKLGYADFKKSENGGYLGINYSIYQSKGEPEKNQMLVLDVNTLKIVWQKEFSFTDNYSTKTFNITNSGKVVFLRSSKSYKEHNYIVLGSSEKQENKDFDIPIILQEPIAISIGLEEYILAFNYVSKSVRVGGDYTNLLLFDLKSGKIIQNSKLSEFNEVPNISKVKIEKVNIQNNEIQIFTEAKVKANVKPATTYSPSSVGFASESYKFGPSHLITTSLDGNIKTILKLNVDENSSANLYHSYGLINIKGTYYINTGNYTGLYSIKNFENNQPRKIFFYQNDPYRNENIKFVNQLVHYFPDNNRLLFARIINNREMSLLSVYGLEIN